MAAINNLTPQERRELVMTSIVTLIEDRIGAIADEDDDFDADLNLDVLDVMEIIMDLEDYFNIDIDGDTADGIVLVNDMIEAVLEQID